MRKFETERGRGDRRNLRYTYTYEIRVNIPKLDKWFTMEGDLRSNTPLKSNQIRKMLVRDLLDQMRKSGFNLDVKDLDFQTFNCSIKR